MLQMSLGVSLLTRCDGERVQHSEKFSAYTVTNICSELCCIMKSQTSYGKWLEEHFLVTRDYFLNFQHGSTLEGIQASIVSWKVKEHFV